MKPEELRIGNWVYDEDEVYGQIEHLQPIFGYAYRWEWLKHYNPIPLTEEWLLKFGMDDGVFEDNQYFSIRKSQAEFQEWSVYFDDEFIGEYIKYVHQLQNLYFALTGEEL